MTDVATAGWYPCDPDDARLQFWTGESWSGRWSDPGIVGRIRWRRRLVWVGWLTFAGQAMCLWTFLMVVVNALGEGRGWQSLLAAVSLGLAQLLAVATAVALFAGFFAASRYAASPVWPWLVAGFVPLTVAWAAVFWMQPGSMLALPLGYACLVANRLGWLRGARVGGWVGWAVGLCVTSAALLWLDIPELAYVTALIASVLLTATAIALLRALYRAKVSESG